MRSEVSTNGDKPLKRAFARLHGQFAAVALFSMCLNFLLFTGPIFMLQVYDRVLGSGSEETLVALFLIVVALFGGIGLIDAVRARILGRIGARFQSDLNARVYAAAMRNEVDVHSARSQSRPLDDLAAVQKLLSSPVCAALFDLPFTPLFLFGIALFHPHLGILALGGAGILVGVALLNHVAVRAIQTEAVRAERKSARQFQNVLAQSETVLGLGMGDALYGRWDDLRWAALAAGLKATDKSGAFSALSKALRLLLQSAMLALAAWLVIGGQATPGVMIASSVLLARALQPIDLIISQWRSIQTAVRGWSQLSKCLAPDPIKPARTPLPKPRAHLVASHITVLPGAQEQPVLRMVTFDVSAGEAMAVIGPSGAGKSSLARVLTGAWRPSQGHVRLDGIGLDQFDRETLGRYVGFLPQSVHLFDGTIAENIARFTRGADPSDIIAAARKADAHAMILRLPEGYDTVISQSNTRLSGGQLQRLGLARAFFGAPTVVILDEPNANLDNDGSLALNNAIRRHKAEGGAVIIMAHRPSAIQECEKLLVLENGAQRAFGPRDTVLAKMVENSRDILRAQHLSKVAQ